VWSHHWLYNATREESEVIGTFYVRWGDAPALWAIETAEGFSLEDLLQELGRLELQALGWVKHGDVPRERSRCGGLREASICSSSGSWRR
jgi:hypothetical protein